jgi:aminopeptidase N
MPGGNLTRDEARERADLISDTSYQNDLDLDSGEETFGTNTTLRFKCSEPGATTFLDFASPEVTEIVINGKQISLDACHNRRIMLFGLDEENEVVIRARGKYSHTGYGLHRFVDPSDGNVYTYSDFEPFQANRVFPCFDQPDIKATFDFSVVAPKDWIVISNMPQKGQTDGARWAFETTPRMSTYISAVVAGPYHAVYDRHGDVDLGLVSRQSLARYLEPEEVFEITKAGFDYYERVFGYPYVFGKYDQVMVPEFISGAMENAGCVTFNERYVFRSKVTEASRQKRADVILHELAHMWFGNLVTMRWWDDLWLNESFATFMAQLSQETTRFADGWVGFANDVKTIARREDQLSTTHPIVADCPDTQSSRLMFDGIAYYKGSSVLRQLVAWVGEEEFFDGLKLYFRKYEYGNTDLADFLGALEESSSRDLRAWSKEWLQTAGVNTLEASFADQDGTIESIEVIQKAPAEWPTLRSHRIAIGLYDDDDKGEIVRRRRVETDVVGGSTPVAELAGEKVPDLLLVNDDDLTYSKTVLDERSLATVLGRLKDMRDPLARGLCWSSAWDMLLDGDQPAGGYVELVANNAPSETDLGVLESLFERPRSILSGVVMTLLGQARAAAQVYGDPRKAEARMNALADMARKAMFAAEPSSDLQISWTKTLASVARSPEDIEYVRALIDGTRELRGLSCDTEMRWWMLRWLAALGNADEERIEKESKLDPTDAGKRYALTAMSGRPTADAKAAAWRRIVEEEALPRADMVAIMVGFQNPDHVDLLRPYTEKFFGELEHIWESREQEIAQAFTSYLYPHLIVDPITVELTDGFLNRANRPQPLRRALLEGRDGIERALFTRSSDR